MIATVGHVVGPIIVVILFVFDLLFFLYVLLWMFRLLPDPKDKYAWRHLNQWWDKE